MTRWKTPLLVTSLILNLLFVGFLFGRFFVHGMFGPHFGPPFGPMAFGVVRLIESLPPARRDELRPMLRDSFARMRPQLVAMRTSQAEVDRALTAQPFDVNALQRSLAQLRAQMISTQDDAHVTLIKIAQRLTPQERAQLADALREAPWMHRRHHNDQREEAPPSEVPAPPP